MTLIKPPKELLSYRDKIKEIDLDILTLLAKRAEIAFKIGTIKKKYGLCIEDHAQEKKVFEANLKLAKKLGLEKSFVKKLTTELICSAKRNQSLSRELSKEHCPDKESRHSL